MNYKFLYYLYVYDYYFILKNRNGNIIYKCVGFKTMYDHLKKRKISFNDIRLYHHSFNDIFKYYVDITSIDSEIEKGDRI